MIKENKKNNKLYRISYYERRQRREDVIREILNGAQQTETSKKYGLSLSYVMTVVRRHCKRANPILYKSLLSAEGVIRQPDGSITILTPIMVIDDIQKHGKDFIGDLA